MSLTNERYAQRIEDYLNQPEVVTALQAYTYQALGELVQLLKRELEIV